MKAASVAALEDGLAALRRHFVERYGEDHSALVVDWRAGRPRIHGTVLVARQYQALEQLARDWSPEPSPPVALEVAILADLAESDPRADERRLRLVGQSAVPVWSRSRGGEQVSEWLPGDGPARVLLETPERWLVQLPDATVAWCARALGEPFTPDAGLPPVVRRLAPSAGMRASAGQLETLFAAARAAAEAGVAYVLGGRDAARGVDCSAFVQGLIEAHLGILLPRHTGDQLACGERVGRGEVTAGDLVFARAQHKNWMHVGLALQGANGDARPVAHACRLEGRVVIEPLAHFLRRYRYLRTQRVLLPIERAEGA